MPNLYLYEAEDADGTEIRVIAESKSDFDSQLDRILRPLEGDVEAFSILAITDLRLLEVETTMQFGAGECE